MASIDTVKDPAMTATELPATPQDPGLHLHLHLRLQPAAQPRGDALYVHGATFPSALSLFFRFDGRSWADALNDEDARTLCGELSGTRCRDLRIERGTHLMHLEESRVELHRGVNEFLLEATP